MTLDETDKKILRLLQKNAQLTFKDIASQINLSLTPVHDRIKRLEKDGYIKKYVTILDKKKVNKGLTCFIQVTLTKQTLDISRAFNNAILDMPEIIECNIVSGSFDYLLKVVLTDMDHYKVFLQEKLSSISEVALISSIFVIDEVKSTTEVCID